MAEIIPGSFSRVSTNGLVNIGNGEYADMRSKKVKELYKLPNFGFAQQGFTPGEGTASMGLPANQAEKNKAATEAMKQFNLNTFQRAAPGILFGQGDSGFQSPAMKARGIGFNNIYNSLFGMGGMQNY